MKIILNRVDFLQAARQLCKVAPETSPLKSVTGILLEADADNLEVTLTSTNIETTISRTLSATVYEGGSVVVNAVLFSEMLRLLGEVTVKLELLKSNQLILTSGNAVYSVATLPAGEFPKPKIPAPEYVGEIEGLCSLVKNTAFVVSKTNTNLALRCVRLDIVGNTARTLTTDGNRLMACKKSLSGKNKPQTLLIPAHAFSLLASLVEDDVKLQLKSSARMVTFESKEMVFTTLLGVGQFIDADSVIANVSGCYDALVDANALNASLGMLDAVASAGDQLHMVFQLGSIALELNSEHAKCKSQAIAQVITPMPPEGFYYPIKALCQGLSAMNGMIKLSVSTAGFLVVTGEELTFFQSPVRYKEKTLKAAGKKKPDAAETAANTAKKPKTKKSASKAA